MAGPFESREVEIVNAIADTIVARTSLVTTTTVAGAGTIAGDTHIVLASATGFAKRGYLHFFDNTFEEMAPIGSIASNTLTLDYAGYSEHSFSVGMVYPHLVGAVVATNLMLHRPIAISEMMRSGKPVIAIWPSTKKSKEFTYGSTLSPIVVRIQIHLAIMQFDAAPIDIEAYNLLQQKACYKGLQTIENALNNNRHLMATYNDPGNHANGLGEGNNNNAPFATSMWDVFIESQGVDIPQAVGAMDVVVRPKRYLRSEP